jgi:hypothetical protein
MPRAYPSAFLIVGALALTALPAGADEDAREVRYDISRNGDRIGTHTVRLQRQGERRTLDHRVEISVRVLGIEAYHYDLRARETWEGGRLLGLRSTVDRNGEPLRVFARTSDDGIRIRRPGGRRAAAPADAIVADPHLDVLRPGRAQMIEAEDGAVRAVTVRGPFRETVRIGDRPIRARRFEVTGEHEATLWYDEAGLLVRKRLRAPDGSTVLTTLR